MRHEKNKQFDVFTQYMGEYLKIDIFGVRKINSNIVSNYNIYRFNMMFIEATIEGNQTHTCWTTL